MTPMRLAALLLGMLLALPAAGQTPIFAEGGARALGMGGAATALVGDEWGHANPASWSTIDGRAIGLFASQSFMLSEMRLAGLVYVEPRPWATLAAGARTLGFDAYRETILTLGVARSLHLGTSRVFHGAATLRYYHIAFGGPYGSGGTIGLSAGWMVEVVPAVHLGFHATNVNMPDLAGQDVPRTLALGLTYGPAHAALVAVDVLKDVRWPATVRGGVEIYPVEAIGLRAGTTLKPTRFTAGLGVRLGRLRADVAADRHEITALGWTPAVSLAYQW